MTRSAYSESDLTELLLHAAMLPGVFFTEMMWRSAASAGWLAMPGPGPERIGDALLEDARIRFDALSRYAALADDFVSGARRTPAAPFWD